MNTQNNFVIQGITGLMTKDGLIQALSRKTGINKRIAEECLNTVFDEIVKALSKSESVSISGFGKFSVSLRKERMGVNPKTKEKIKIPEMKIPKFKAGQTLKDAVK